MIEQQIDLWSCLDADAICITTNGYVKQSGYAVMGRGVAKQATERMPGIALDLGRAITRHGHRVIIVRSWEPPGTPAGVAIPIVAFPVKHHWCDAADPELIARSAGELNNLAGAMGWQKVVLPRPGCGNGRLSWDTVRPLLHDLDDRFVVVTNGKS